MIIFLPLYVKIWDTLKGQIQTEFADFFTTDSTSILTKSGKGHLSVDYKCMKWLSLEKKVLHYGLDKLICVMSTRRFNLLVTSTRRSF